MTNYNWIWSLEFHSDQSKSKVFWIFFLKIKIKWSLDGWWGRVDDETRTGHVALFNKNRRSDWLINLEYFCGSKFPVFVSKISDIWSITLGMFFFDKDAKWPFQITYFSSSLIFGYFHIDAKIFKNFSAVKIREILENYRETRVIKLPASRWCILEGTIEIRH